MAPRVHSLRLLPPEESPLPGPIDVDVGESKKQSTKSQDGTLTTEHNDGSATIDFSPGVTQVKNSGRFNRNIASEIDQDELDRIASELLEGIQRDEDSRKEWLDTRARGIKLLGLKIEEPGSDTGAFGSAPLEGMSRIRHPLLLESTLRFQANARGELLPATGPVKVRNDTPVKPQPPPVPQTPPAAPQAAAPPPPPGMGHNGGPSMGGPMPPQMNGAAPTGPAPSSGPMPPPGAAPTAPMPTPVPPPMPGPLPGAGAIAIPEVENVEELASALELDMNHYLTSTAKEYYPDTDRMLFYIGFGGQGFKKVFNCPIRQRPVSESVDAEDVIISNSATGLENCARVTHRIRMRPSTLKRMQLIGAYLDVQLSTPVSIQPNIVERAKQEISGIKPQTGGNLKDEDHLIYECYCELDIRGFEHKKGNNPTGLQCPYKVTIHKESRKILEVRRNWKEDDKLCLPKMFFVEFPFVRALGFYGIGLVHIAGNLTNTLTAAYREMLDAGMFASFPGFLYDKQVGRQLTNQFRVPPGGGIGLELGGRPIAQVVSPLPYKEPGAGMTTFISHVEEVGQRVAGTAEMNIGEGKQDVPVGTTLALIEQATKVMDAVHKRLHAAQAQEFALLKERFREDPEAFWRHNEKPTLKWKKEQFLKALDVNDLVPVADPNNPTSLHRIAKATAIKVLQQANPAIYDAKAVDMRIMRIVGIDPEGLFNNNPSAVPPDPRAVAAQAKAQADQAQATIQAHELQQRGLLEVLKLKDASEERASRERVEASKLQLEQLRIAEEKIIHARDAAMEQQKAQGQLAKEAVIHLSEQHAAHQDRLAEQQKHEQKIQLEREKHATGIQSDHIMHQQKLVQSDQQHEQKLAQAQQQHEQTLETQKAAAKAKPKAKKD